eukprot:jgi/Tetstr1/447725/TSEL_000302.t1
MAASSGHSATDYEDYAAEEGQQQQPALPTTLRQQYAPKPAGGRSPERSGNGTGQAEKYPQADAAADDEPPDTEVAPQQHADETSIGVAVDVPVSGKRADYRYTLAAPTLDTLDGRHTVYQLTGHRQLVVVENQNVLVLDLLLELVILLHTSLPSYFESCPSSIGDGGSAGDYCDSAGQALSWLTLLALPVLLSFGTALLTLSIGILGDVWSSFEWAKACKFWVLSVSWFYYAVIVVMPTSVFAVAAAASTSGGSPVRLARCVEISIIAVDNSPADISEPQHHGMLQEVLETMQGMESKLDAAAEGMQHAMRANNEIIIDGLQHVEKGIICAVIASQEPDGTNEVQPERTAEGQPPDLTAGYPVNAGYLNANTFDVFFLCCIQLTHVLPALGNEKWSNSPIEHAGWAVMVLLPLMSFLVLLGIGGFMASSGLFEIWQGICLMVAIVVITIGITSYIAGNVQKAIKESGGAPVPECASCNCNLDFSFSCCSLLGKGAQSVSAYWKRFQNGTRTLLHEWKRGPIVYVLVWDVVICVILPITVLSVRSSKDGRYLQFLFYFTVCAVCNAFIKLYNVEQAFSNAPATETEVMESLMTKEGAGDRGWNLARQVYLFRTRIYNKRCQAWVWWSLIVILIVFNVFSQAPMAARTYDGPDSAQRVEASSQTFATENLYRGEISLVDLNGGQEVQPPACLGAYTMSGMIPGMTALDYAVLSMISYTSSTEAEYQAGTSVEHNMLNAYFGNGTVELLSEFNTRFSPSSPASRTFKVSQNITGEKGDGASLVVVVRGTKNTFDWLANINMWIEVALIQSLRFVLPFGSLWDAAYPDLIYALGGINYFQSKDTLRPDLALESHWRKNITEKFPVDSSRYVFTGHSLGGGVAAITASRVGHPAITFNAPNARLSHKKFGTTAEKLDNYTINVIPRHDIVPRIDLPSLRSVDILCRVNPDAFPFDAISCHNILSGICELQHTCGSMGRPFLKVCCCESDAYRYVDSTRSAYITDETLVQRLYDDRSASDRTAYHRRRLPDGFVSRQPFRHHRYCAPGRRGRGPVQRPVAAAACDSVAHGSERPGMKSEWDAPAAIPDSAVDEWVAHMKANGISRAMSLLSQRADILLPLHARPIRQGLQRQYSRQWTSWKAADAAGEKVVLHCAGGQGRTGLILASWLVKKYGMSPDQAVAEMMICAKDNNVSRADISAKLPGLLRRDPSRQKAQTKSATPLD